MKWGWFAVAFVVWILSASCAIGTVVEGYRGRGDTRRADFWGGVAFHGVTAVLALWLFLKALGKA